ncbi:FecR family protein [Xanthobacter sp. V4C-4]|uniref:FecR family protein n=1 Tax=Xanthobacter cornucopiae TaxID=3119924 RepID=UPI00372B0652
MPKSQARDTSGGQTPKDAALAWFVKVRSGEATAAEQADFARWIAAAGDNRRAFEQLEALWGDLDRLGDPRRAPVAARRAQPARPAFSRRAVLAGGAAAAAGLALGVPYLFRGDLQTGIGEQRALALADGSRVELDADSALDLDFTARARRLTLLRGRAFFDVAPDADRPFSVAAADGVTTAAGTQFSVHRWSDEVTVTVIESAVAIEVGADRLARLKAGEAVSYGAAGIGETGPASDAEATAWRRGKLIFEDRPLQRVIAEVNRYRRGSILVTNSDLLRLRVSGIFDVNRPDGVLDAITGSLPVRALALTRYLVLLYPA